MNLFAAIFERIGAAEKRPGVSTEPKDIDMASVTKFPVEKQPDAGTVHWLDTAIARSKTGVFAEMVTVTPWLAAELLRRNPDNRTIHQTKLRHYVTDMLNGVWQMNGEPIIVSSDGQLNDGQHRLSAIIEANISLPFLIVFGVGRETRTTVDQGDARTAGDFLSMDGVPYANNASTMAKWLMAYEASGGTNISQRASFTNAQIVARVKADDAIVEAAKYGHRHYKYYRSFASLTIIGTAFYILSEINAADAETFMDQVCLGENIKRGDPAFAVRSYLQNLERVDTRAPSLEIIFHGWNAYRRRVALKRISSNGRFPALV